MYVYFSSRQALFRYLAVIAVAILVPVSPGIRAAEGQPRTITVEMGDYRFSPDEISVRAGETVRLELHNTDTLTPHNFTLKEKNAGLDIDVDVGAGKTRTVEFTPQWPGSYTFFCNKKLPFMKSHRDRGMHGTLIVTTH
jgi:plastocyanin